MTVRGFVSDGSDVDGGGGCRFGAGVHCFLFDFHVRLSLFGALSLILFASLPSQL